jgi:hypothetical protein
VGKRHAWQSCKYLVELVETRQGMTRIDPQWGSATGAIITRQIDGGTDLAFAKPGTRSTTILCDLRVPGHIIGQGFHHWANSISAKSSLWNNQVEDTVGVSEVKQTPFANRHRNILQARRDRMQNMVPSRW